MPRGAFLPSIALLAAAAATTVAAVAPSPFVFGAQAQIHDVYGDDDADDD